MSEGTTLDLCDLHQPDSRGFSNLRISPDDLLDFYNATSILCPPRSLRRFVLRVLRQRVQGSGGYSMLYGSKQSITSCNRNSLSAIRSMRRYDIFWIVAFLLTHLVIVFGLTIPIVFDSSNVWHRSIQYHPEQPARIDTCINKIREIPGVELFDVTPDPTTQVINDIQLAPFSEEELQHARRILLQTHDPNLIDSLEMSCRESRKRRVEEGRPPLGFVGNIDEDTFVTTETFDVCLRATAAWIRALDSAMDGGNDSRAAMALTRPPGHHATYETANGFCLMNFAAAAAIHAMERDPILKISIFDWDVHYGQGVAQILGKHQRSRYVSIHQSPAFPYLGGKFETTGDHNNVMTVPITADTTWSLGYREKFMNHVLPFVMSETWQPDLVLICAGYDALDSDELASVSLVASDYAEMLGELKRHLKSKSDKGVPIALGLEGGYQLSEMAGGGNLGDAVASSIKALLLDE